MIFNETFGKPTRLTCGSIWKNTTTSADQQGNVDGSGDAENQTRWGLGAFKEEYVANIVKELEGVRQRYSGPIPNET